GRVDLPLEGVVMDVVLAEVGDQAGLSPRHARGPDDQQSDQESGSELRQVRAHSATSRKRGSGESRSDLTVTVRPLQTVIPAGSRIRGGICPLRALVPPLLGDKRCEPCGCRTPRPASRDCGPAPASKFISAVAGSEVRRRAAAPESRGNKETRVWVYTGGR